jgi:hypothetical protein
MSRILGSSIAALALMGLAAAANACSCGRSSLADDVDAAESILVVRIVAVEDMAVAAKRSYWTHGDDESPPGESKSMGLAARFILLRPIKLSGPVPELLRTGYGMGGDCGIRFDPGANYLVFASASGGTSACTSTRKIGAFDAISCVERSRIAAIERRLLDSASVLSDVEVDSNGDTVIADDDYGLSNDIIEALRGGKPAFEAGCAASESAPSSP